MRILLSAGEASGDFLGANLARCLLAERPDLELAGLGGRQMEAAGVRLLYPLVDLAVVGFAEVLKGLREHKHVYDLALDYASQNPLDGAILIDYPGFNLRLAAALKKRGIPVFYYVSPQVWAWGRWRIPKMRRLIQHMLVILPFEEPFFQEAGIPATFVGHPLLEEVGSEVSRTTALVKAGLDPERPVVGLLPGSRKVEVHYMLKPMVAAAEIIRNELPQVQFVLPRAPLLNEDLLLPHVQGTSIHIVPGDDYGLRKAIDVAITASGTATLVNAILETPMIIVYKTSWLSFQIARQLARIDRIGLVNIIAGEMVCRELIQGEMTPGRIAQEAVELLKDNSKRVNMRAKLATVHQRLGTPGASMRAAQKILRLLS